MGVRPLSDEETAFAECVTEFFGFIEKMQATAHAVKESGGDTQYTFVTAFPEEVRGQIAMQWPILSMALGL